MIIHELHDSSESKGLDVLKRGLSNIVEQDLAVNYHPYYSSDPANIFYLLEQGRYSQNNGCYFVIEEQENYIGSAGWNLYTESIVLCLTRAYFLPEYRHRYIMAEHLLPRIFEQASSKDTFWITCNEYNKNIYDGLVLLQTGKKAGFYDSWPDVYRKFKPIGTRIVNNSVQYVAEYKR